MKKMSKDDIGDRMKAYEKRESFKTIPFLPVIARLDGRSFSKLTHGMRRPYDEAFVNCMKNTTQYLVEKTGAQVGYTQSDEITLIWRNGEGDAVFFDGKIQKMCSILAAMASLEFAEEFTRSFFMKSIDMETLPMFDCRVFQVPNKTEAINCLVWREIDATKNSVQMLARCHYSHKELEGKSRVDQMNLLMKKGINWNDEIAHFKRGTYFARRKVFRKYTLEEREKLPPKHNAVTNPDLVVERTSVVELDFPPITKVLNAARNLLDGKEDIILKTHNSCAAAHNDLEHIKKMAELELIAPDQRVDSPTYWRDKLDEALKSKICKDLPEHGECLSFK